ncbi:hypothetical protein OQA88_9175 [Cercophora sp. LCS_1]
MAMEVRKATVADQQAILNIVLAAAASESQWQYCFPQRTQHYDEHAAQTAAALERCLNDPDDWLVAVSEVTQPVVPKTKTIVSVGIWYILDSGAKAYEDEYCDNAWKQLAGGGFSVRKDGHPARLAAFIDGAALGRDKFLNSAGPQMHLHVLATHPRHQGKGYAKTVCEWGLEWAASSKLVVSTLASTKGYVFFSGLGFRDVGCVVIKAPGDGEELMLKAMVVAGKERTGSSILRFLGLSG